MAPRLVVEPSAARVDELVVVRMEGMPPRWPVTLEARLCDQAGTEWRSIATFVSQVDGTIDLRRDHPLRGSYDEVDAMGPFWSMQLDGVVPPGRFVKADLMPMTITLSAAGHGLPGLSASLERTFVAPTVQRRVVREDGLVGELLLPPGAGPHPGVLLLPGSGGGVPLFAAALLASHGLAAFALAYFGMEGLPAELIEIPLEYVERALAWLAGQPRVDGQRLGVAGTSKGAELALLVAATYPERVRAVVAFAPSSVVHVGISRPTDERGPRSSWSYRGEPLPFARPPEQSAAPGTPGYLATLEDPDAFKQAAIHVERIRGGILLISGTDDGTWPSSLFGELIMERLEQHGHPYPREHLSFAGAGHLVGFTRWALGFPYMPAWLPPAPNVMPGRPALDTGGSPRANARAQAAAWPAAVRFLKEQLV